MKNLCKSNGLLMAAVLTAGALASCSSDEETPLSPANGTGRLSIQIGTEADFITRALNEDNWKNPANYTVQILNKAKETVKSYPAGTTIPAEIEIPYGQYTVKAYCGTEEIMSRNTFKSEGERSINLTSGDKQAVSLVCTPTCGKVNVSFEDGMSTYFKEYYVTFSTPKMTTGNYATWDATDSEPWYLAVSNQGDDVTATIHLTPNKEYETDKTNTNGATLEGTVVRTYNLKRNKAWTLNIAPNYSTATGELGISITIDDSTNDHGVDITIPSEWI